MRSHDSLVLGKLTTDVCGQCHLVRQVAKWQLDDSDQQTFGRCTVGDCPIEQPWEQYDMYSLCSLHSAAQLLTHCHLHQSLERGLRN